MVEIRRARTEDLSNGLLDSLKSLSDPQLTLEKAVEAFWVMGANPIIYVALVDGKVVGCASMLMERKLIHSGGKVGHIEDVAVHKEYQGQGIGKALVEYLVKEGREAGCYKLILDCNPDLISFYEQAGFRQWCVAMRIDL